jgi:transposase
VLRKTLRREKLMELIASLPPCRIGIEARAGAHAWARQFERHGHRVGIMMARFVAAYRKSSKNDGNDAEAICEAVGRPTMRFVPVKTAEQQPILSLHRVRQGFIEERTATINRIRGLLAEFGVVLPQRAEQVRRAAVVAAEALPVPSREAIAELRAHLTYRDERINRYERQLVTLAKAHEPARRVQGVPGVGPLRPPRRSPPASPPATNSPMAGSSPRGSVWCHDNIPLAAKPNWGASPSAATATCVPC